MAIDILKQVGKAEAPSSPAVDILKARNLSAPSVGERNINAINNVVKLPSVTAGVASDVSGGEGAVAIEQHRQEQEFNKLASTRFTPEKIQEFKSNPITFTQAGDFIDIEDVVPGGGFKKAYDTFGISAIADKMKAGESLTPSENKTMNEFIDKTVEMRLRGFSFGGGIAYYGSQMPAFMTEFALTGGVGKLAQTAALKATVGVAQKGAIAGVASKGIALSANIGARSAVMPQRYIPTYAERRLNDFMAVTDKGDVLFQESKETPAVSAMKAFGYTLAEVASELSGAAIGKFVVNPVTGALKTPLVSAVNQLPEATQLALYKAYQKLQPNAQVSKVLSRIGWHGMLQELGEERVNDILVASIDAGFSENPTMDEFLDAITPSKDQLMLEAGLISIMGGVTSSANIVANRLEKRGVERAKVQEQIINLSAQEKDGLADELLPLPQSGFAADGDSVSEITPERTASEVLNKDPVEEGADDVLFDFTEQETQSLQDAGIDVVESRVKVADLDRVQEAVKPTTSAKRAENAINELGRGIQGSQKQVAESVEPPAINNDESGFNKLYRDWLNQYQPIENAQKLAAKRGAEINDISNPKLLISTYANLGGIIEQNLQVNTTKFDENGNVVVTGKSLKSISDDWDNVLVANEPSMDKRREDINKYLIARRFTEDLQDREGFESTEQQRIQMATDMAEIANKYDSKIEFFDQFAQELYDYQKRVLHNLVDSGVWSEQRYEETLKENPNYIPFQRVMDEDKAFSGIAGKGAFKDVKANSLIKKIRGSERDIKDVFGSVTANTAKIMDAAWRNNVSKSIASLATWVPENIQQVNPPLRKKGTAKVKITFDKKLREKLEKGIEVLGGKLSREKAIQGKGFIRGQFSPEEKLVRQRIGSNEGTLTHEFGHMLDFELGLKQKMLGDAKVKAELQKLAEGRLSTTLKTEKGEEGITFLDELTDAESSKFKAYVKNDREVLANMFDAFVNAPDLLNEKAPNAAKMFNKILDDAIAADGKLAFVRDIKPSLERQEETIEQDVFGIADIIPADQMVVMDGGKRKFYKVSKPIMEAINGMEIPQLDFATKMIASSSALLRAGATVTPEFIARSLVRETHTALVQGEVKPRPIDVAKSFAELYNKGDLYNQYVQSGSKFASHIDLSDNALENAYAELLRGDGKLMRYAKNPLNIANDISANVDMLPRLASFIRAKKEGRSDLSSAFIARETTVNFARAGRKSKVVNRYVPFFNVGMQGSDRMIRAVKDNPRATAVWGLATVTLPSVLITGYYLYSAPDDEREEFLNIPLWQRDMFWNFKQGGEWIKIPKPFSFGYAFGSSVERFMLWGYDGDKPEMENMVRDTFVGLGMAVTPVYDPSSLIPPMFKAGIEWTTNYNFFMGRNIYPSFLDKLPPEQRVNKYTSETAKQVGEALGVSPALLDNTLRTMIGGSAKYVTRAGDEILNSVKEWNGEVVPEKPLTKADMALISAFVSRTPTGNRAIRTQNFYRDWDKIKQAHAGFNKLEGEDKKEFRDKNAALISLYRPIKPLRKQISQLNKKATEIYNHPTLSGQEKVKRILAVENQILTIAKQANTIIRQRKADK